MADLWMVHREEYTFSQNQLGREYAKQIADVWRGEGLIVEEQEKNELWKRKIGRASCRERV